MRKITMKKMKVFQLISRNRFVKDIYISAWFYSMIGISL